MLMFVFGGSTQRSGWTRLAKEALAPLTKTLPFQVTKKQHLGCWIKYFVFT